MQNQIIEGFRLSPQQKRFWLLKTDGLIEDFAQCAIRIEGQIEVELLRVALQQVCDRHEVLRTRFHRQAGMKFPLQVIAESSHIIWNFVDASNLSIQEQSIKVEAIQAKNHYNYSCEEDLAICADLVKLSAEQHILIIKTPSICADSWTLKNLVREISRAYAACLNATELSEETIQYLQFSEWQNELIEGEDAATGKTYWQQQLQSLSELTLPFEGEFTEKKKFIPAVYAIKIESELITKLEAIAFRNNVTISEVLLTCWQILLWQLTEESDIVVRTIFDGRKYEELHEVLGLLAKWLPIRCDVRSQYKFTEVLSQLRSNLQSASEWQEYFLEDDSTVVDFPVSYEFVELLDRHFAGDVSFTLEKQSICFEPFKLKLTCLQTPESLTAEFQYNTELFDLETIQAIATQFQTLVASVVNNPEATVDELEIISDRIRHQLLVECNNTQINYPQGKLIHQLFEQQVERSLNKIAVVFEQQQLTYAELNARANKVARYLQRQGVKAETLVGICLERSLDFIVALLGILKAGGAYLPLDPAFPTANLAFRLQDAQVSVLLTQTGIFDTEVAQSPKIIYLDADWQAIAQESDTNPNNQLKPENLAYVLYTSGSTGQPKGVAIEHRQILNYVYAIAEKLQLPAGASFATVSTFAADLGNTAIFPALCMGGCLHIIAPHKASDPAALADYFDRHPIDCLKIVPSHLTALLTSSAYNAILPRQCLVLGGEAVSWDLIKIIQQYAPNCRIINHYGPTETTVGVLTYPLSNQHNYNSKTVPIGRAIANTQVYLLDPQLQPVPIGVPGELYIGGAGLARGYLHQAQLTSEKFVAHPFVEGARLYKTGDRARYLPDRNIEFLGRLDDQVKIRGFRIELGEIETILTQHPEVKQAVVVACEDLPGDRILAAYIVPKRKPAPSSNDLRHFLQARLPDYMLPSAFAILKAFPLTPNGKIDRRALPAPERVCPEVAYVAPRSVVEQQLVEIWAKVLGLERVGIHENFFELGGHSLLLTQLLVQVRDTFQVDLSLGNLFEAPTVLRLAERIEAARQAKSFTSDRDFVALRAEAVLDPTIHPDTTKFVLPGSEKSIFLTGATGFLGAFLLYELLQQTTANIYCLVRQGKKQLQTNLESYLLWDESFSDRIIPVVGDLAQPLLGLDELQFQAIASQIDVIYHNGAWVHHTLPYSTLKAANVLGTQEILRLASQNQLKPVHFISTTSVFGSTGHEGIKVVREQDSLDNSQVSANGYAQSKWVAEQLVNTARDRGIPVCIYRPGRISGHSQTGVFNPNDFLYKLIVGCVQLGSAPAGDESFDLAPVDYVSQAIVYLSKQKASLNKTFHVVNLQLLDSNLLIDSMRSLGYPIQQISYDRWRTELLNIARHSPEHPLYPLVPFFPARESQTQTASGELKFDCQNTLAGLAGTSIICPPIDRQLLHIYFSYLIRNGFLNVPKPCSPLS